MDINKVAKSILKHVGGEENIKDVSHCFTRLRLVLKDETKADKQAVERLEGVIQVVISGGQFQIEQNRCAMACQGCGAVSY